MLRGSALGLGMALSLLLASAAARGADGAAHPTPGPSSAAGPALTLRGAVARAVTSTPRLQGQSFARAAADARQQAAALRPAFEAGLDIENVAGTGGVRGFRDTEITLRIATLLELGDKRGRRVDVARGERGLLLTEQDAERLDLVAEVARRFIAVAAGQETLALAHRQQELAERAEEATRARLRAGKAAQAELSRAQIALIQARIAVDNAGHELASARVALAATWDAREPDFGAARSAFFEVPPAAPFADLVAQSERNPDLVRFASEARVLEAQARLAEAKRSPDLKLGVGVRRLESLDGQAFVLSLAMPFASSARAAPAVREARAAIGQAGTRERAARAELYRTLFSINEELRHASEAVSTLTTEVLPLARKALDETEQGFRGGRFSLLELAEARRQLVEAERDRIAAAADYHRLAIEMERLTGRSIASE